MLIRIRETHQVISDSDFKLLHHTTSFPTEITREIVETFGADIVLKGIEPEITNNQYIVNDGLQEINGQWHTKYTIVDYTSEEITARLEQWRQSATCSPFQGKAALFNAGLLDDVETLISAAETSTIVKLAWANASEWRRSSTMIASLASALSMTDEQVDDLFKAAARISA